MIGAPIIVDIAPNPADRADLAAALIDACSAVAGGGGCVLRGALPLGTSARALAVVSFDGAGGKHARIDVASPGSRTDAVQVREIAFRDEDLLPDRYRAAGLAVAALVGDSSVAESEVAPKGTCPPAPDAPQVLDHHPARRWSLAAGGLVGGGVEAGPPRVGAWATTLFSPTKSGIFGSVSTSYAAAAAAPAPRVSLQWVAVGAGGGVLGLVAPLDLLARGRIEAQFSWAIVSARDAPSTPSSSARVFDVGASSTVEIVWPASTRIAFVAGVGAFLGTHTTNVRVHGQPDLTLALGYFTSTAGIEGRMW